MRKLCFGIFFLCTFYVYSGDVAVFTDLGFSEDGRYYIFAQYGVEEKTLFPWAELFIVDVAANDFVQGGRISYKHNKEIEAGQDGSGALYTLIAKNTALAARYGVNFLRQGVPLYISLEESKKALNVSIDFRDFETSSFYKAQLVPSFLGSGELLKSSFFINLEINNDSKRDEPQSYLTVGTPSIQRSKITSYTIRKILGAPDRASLIFVIEMAREKSSGEAPDIRYMIEAVRVK